MNFTVLVHPHIDPVAFSIGPLAVRWYGLMYLAGFAAAWWLGVGRIARGAAPVTRRQFDDLLFVAVLGVILGGRLGYVLFYKPGHYLSNPLEIFAIWQGGMSFHGGLLGVMAAMAFAAWRHRIDYLRLMDFVAPLCPLGIAAGRMGNFINGELWGRVTDVPWGMVFRGAGDAPRHPSQLYQFALEGMLLFIILWWYSAKPRPRGAVSAASPTLSSAIWRSASPWASGCACRWWPVASRSTGGADARSIGGVAPDREPKCLFPPLRQGLG